MYALLIIASVGTILLGFAIMRRIDGFMAEGGFAAAPGTERPRTGAPLPTGGNDNNCDRRMGTDMRSMLVIGAGRFGSNLAVKLTQLGNEALVIDMDEDVINKLTSQVTRAQIGDCMDADSLRALGVRNFDVCFVCISDNFQSSMEITSLLKELGAKRVVSKTDSAIHADLLRKIGADDVVYPERDMAQRTAVRYSARGAFDYIELSPEYAIMEIAVPHSWVGRRIKELDVRARHSINVIGTRIGEKIAPVVSAEHIFGDGEHLIVAGEHKNIISVMNK